MALMAQCIALEAGAPTTPTHTPLSARAAWRGLMNSCSLDATPLVTDGLAWPGQAGRRRPQPNSRAALVDGHAHSQAETAGPPNTDPDHLLARHTRTGGV